MIGSLVSSLWEECVGRELLDGWPALLMRDNVLGNPGCCMQVFLTARSPELVFEIFDDFLEG